MAYQLYSSPYEKYYCAHPLAPAALVCYCTYFLIGIVPFLLVASTQNLWISQVLGMEQLDMNFKNDNNFHISVLLYDTVGATHSTYTITNLYQQTQLNNVEDEILMSSITHSDIDYNQDGKIDHLEIGISLIPKVGYSIKDIEAVIFMGVGFSQYTKISSRGMLRFRTNNIANKNLGGVVFAGSPQLKIKKPLPRSKYTNLEIYNENPFISGWMLIDKIYEKYYQRDFRIDAEYQTHITSCHTDSQITSGLNTQTDVKIILELDKKQQILYKPSFIHLIREAWVQYFALLFPSIFIGKYFLQFVYKYKFFSTYLQDNLPKDNKLY